MARTTTTTAPKRRGRPPKKTQQLDESNKLFGLQIGDEDQSPRDQLPRNKTFALPQNEDGALTVAGAGYFGTYVDLDGTFRNETALITKYRELALQAEIETALDQIVNEAIVFDRSGTSVSLNTDELKIPETIKTKIHDEFDRITKMLNFTNMGHEIFRRWYIDGRLFYHIVVDENNLQAGVQEIRYIDPRRIRKIREIQKMRDPATGIEIIKKQIEYYLYNERGMLGSSTNLGSKIAVDSIINVNSGLMDAKQTMVLSYLHKAIKPFNNLRMVEDAVVIYRLSRAPERRIFYIDVGNMPTQKAEQYVRDIMVKYRNKLVYDSSTGQIKDDRKHLSMLEDFWLPRREGSKGTEIDTLQGGQNLGQLEDVKHFEQKLYKALNIPLSRLDTGQGGFSLGRATEISREEVNFAEFVSRLRTKFATLFDDLLRMQLVLKKVCTDEEWRDFKEDIWYDFKVNNNFDEMRDTEILMNRIMIVQALDPFVGRYFPAIWVRKEVLKQTEEQIAEMDQQMAVEAQQMNDMMLGQQADQMALQQGFAPPEQPQQPQQQQQPPVGTMPNNPLANKNPLAQQPSRFQNDSLTKKTTQR